MSDVAIIGSEVDASWKATKRRSVVLEFRPTSAQMSIAGPWPWPDDSPVDLSPSGQVGPTAVPTPDGAMVVVDDCKSRANLDELLQMVREHLQQQGWSGELGAPPREQTPHGGWDDSVGALSLGIVLPVELDPDTLAVRPPPTVWGCDEATTATVLELARAWLQPCTDRLWTFASQPIRLRPSALEAALTMAIERGRNTFLKGTSPSGEVRAITINSLGHVAYQVYAPDAVWQTDYERCLTLLRDHAHVAQHGFVRRSRIGNASWQSISRHFPTRDGFEGNPTMFLIQSTKTATQLLPDIYPAQLVTGTHLAALDPADRPPPGWHLQDLGHDRHLLATDNPTEWLDEDPANYLFRDTDNLRPTPELLDQTRQRFTAILTKPRMSK